MKGIILDTINKDRQRLKIIVNLVVLAMALYGVSQQKRAYRQTSGFDNLMIDTFAPIQKSVVYLRDQFSSFFEHYVFNVNASKENKELKKSIDDLNQQIFSLQELERENIRLKELLRFSRKFTGQKVLAQIVAWDSSSDFRVLRVNKGAADGLSLQSPVVTADGLVGYVYRMTDHFSDVLTILDPNNRVDSMVKRIRTHGIVEGYSTGKTLMKYVTRIEPVILGDVVITSGLGNLYPKGLKVGTVDKIERESYGITQYIEVTPSVDFTRLEEVVILAPGDDEQKRKEWKALETTIDSE